MPQIVGRFTNALNFTKRIFRAGPAISVYRPAKYLRLAAEGQYEDAGASKKSHKNLRRRSASRNPDVVLGHKNPRTEYHVRTI